MKNKKFAFTLAETLITLTILGVIAAITVPSLINKQIENANRTKLKKAMTMYEKALNQMIIDYDLKTNDAIKAEFNNDNCETSSVYFKPVETTDSACRFKTADRVWWDISDIEAPVISLKDEIKTETNATTVKGNAEKLASDHTSFVMIGYLDDTTGVLRINDLGVAADGGTIPTAKNKTYISKLYNFMNNQEEVDPDIALFKSLVECDDDVENYPCYYGLNFYNENGIYQTVGDNFGNFMSCSYYSDLGKKFCEYKGYDLCNSNICFEEGSYEIGAGFCHYGVEANVDACIQQGYGGDCSAVDGCCPTGYHFDWSNNPPTCVAD